MPLAPKSPGPMPNETASDTSKPKTYFREGSAQPTLLQKQRRPPETLITLLCPTSPTKQNLTPCASAALATRHRPDDAKVKSKGVVVASTTSSLGFTVEARRTSWFWIVRAACKAVVLLNGLSALETGRWARFYIDKLVARVDFGLTGLEQIAMSRTRPIRP